MYAVILAGGGGTRLRPLSHDDRPKPFLPLLGERTLIQETVERVRWLVEGAVYVVTDARYADLVHEQVPDRDASCASPSAATRQPRSRSRPSPSTGRPTRS